MEQELRAAILPLLPRIKENNTIFSEREKTIIVAAFLAITGHRLSNTSSCGGRLCTDIQRSIVNYFKINPTVAPTPVKTKTREDLITEADELSEAKGLKKVNRNIGLIKLNQFLHDNRY